MLRVGIVCALAAVLVGASRGAEPTIEDVKKAWKARQEANKTFRADWTETVTYKAGSYGSTDPKDPGPHPPKDTELKVTRSFATDGDKVESVNDWWIYVVQEKEFRPYKVTFRFDGTTTLFFDPKDKSWGWPMFRIETDKDTAAGFVHDGGSGPLRLVYRSLGDRVLTGGLENYKLSGRTEQIRGTKCVELVRKGAAEYGSIDSLWCDPERQFLPIRYTHRNENAGEDVEWEYRKDDKGRWVLSGWQHTEYSGKGGKNYVVRSTTKAEVKKLEFDVTFPADAFSTRPPPHSAVTVAKAFKRQEYYILRPDGSKRSVGNGEGFMNYDELAKTNADGTPYVPPKK